nr:MAG TPA: hypothetical protein [Caudoviricetes sp.]
MENLVEKVIKLCDNICNGNYPIDNLGVYKSYNTGFTINNKLAIFINSDTLNISTNKGILSVNMDIVEKASIIIAFQKLEEYSKQLAETVLDEYINVENTKISNINELDCNN